MEKLYIITGADGHLGNTIIRFLEKKGDLIRGLILPEQHRENRGKTSYLKGNLINIDSLKPLFHNSKKYQTIVIHTAGIISIEDKASNNMYNVNVNGTQNIVKLSIENKVFRFVYVSSVHAIPEKESVISEANHFSPDTVHGGYAKTKAIATQLVLDSAKNGLNAVILHPSGIIGPYGREENHLIQMITSYANKKLPACVKGGYDFVDVRDVAKACIVAASCGEIGECYILSNKHYDIKEIFEIVRNIKGCKKVPVLPIWVAKLGMPFMKLYAKCKKQRPLYTRYSLYTLSSNDQFSHEKATKYLRYNPRDIRKTIRDTLKWLKVCTN